MLLNARKWQGYNIYCFWVIKKEPTGRKWQGWIGEVKLSPSSRLRLTFIAKLLLTTSYLVLWLTVLKISIENSLFSFMTFCYIILQLLVLWMITVLKKILKKSGNDKDKLRTIYPRNHESFTNNMFLKSN